ncbi:hypothetical protein ABW286_17620 [Erwinia papayae]|uniref:Uncharacterized protein n=1 Tax=Erwinia papayae TaxID=206499 RepID=A0ABV3N5G8_9GAMM
MCGPAAGQASDRSIPVTCPLLDLNDPPQIADFIAAWLRNRR